jgi:hypothetical protein
MQRSEIKVQQSNFLPSNVKSSKENLDYATLHQGYIIRKDAGQSSYPEELYINQKTFDKAPEVYRMHGT